MALERRLYGQNPVTFLCFNGDKQDVIEDKGNTENSQKTRIWTLYPGVTVSFISMLVADSSKIH